MSTRFLTPFTSPLSLLLGTVAATAALSFSSPPIGEEAPDLAPTASDPTPTAPEANAIPGNSLGSGPLHKIWLRSDEESALLRLQATGSLVRLYDYGSFRVAVVDDRLAGGGAFLRGGEWTLRDEQNLIALNGHVLDGTQPEPTLSSLAPSERFSQPGRTELDPTAELYLVQFEGPVRDEWLSELDALGVDFRQFVPMNAFVVHLAPERVLDLQALAAQRDHIQFAGHYEPPFRMHPKLRQVLGQGLNAPQALTVQLIDVPGVRSTLAELAEFADRVLSVRKVGPYINVDVELHPAFFGVIAANGRVFQMEPRGQITRFDERQGQILAGNTNATGPSAPGYLAWLTSMGFDGTQFGSFAVNVVDDATFLTGHPDLASSRIAFAQNPTNQGGQEGGHGFLNANIVAGFNNGTGTANEDSQGYNYGLGIAPWARVGSTAIFGPSGSSPTTWENSAYGSGARISSNSWGFQSAGNPIPDYDTNAQEFDFITRDAQGGTGGNQELFVVFAAGNDGSGSNTVSTPGTAKNVLTVAASENDRQTGTDGCGIGNTGANNYNDIIGFSSRGPVDSAGGDGRWKPEIAAPGTHIEAGIPQSNYGGTSVCNKYFPSGQTLYGWSSGTSHSTPALAGSAALVYQWFLNQGMNAPSPAMLKAVLVASGEYMTGVGANDTLPSNSQGTGNVDLARIFDGTAKLFDDQAQLLSATGQSFTLNASVADSAQPLRVALVWTDAPGATSGAPYVNNLDLTVDAGGNTYLGNVFSGAFSSTGGSADFRNNTELVFLPAGTTGNISITVNAASIGGDGVPGNGDTTDQDFALYVFNASTGAPTGPVAGFTGSPTSGINPLTVSFTDSSSAGVTTWSWDFGDGNTSSAQNPSNTYLNPGTYSVTLTVTDPTGSDTLTRTNYITVSAPPTPGIADGSFEQQTAGGTPAAPWIIAFGSGHVINPNGGTASDGGMPTDGANWLDISATSTNNATPPSNPGGVTNPPSGGAGLSQTFFYGTGTTLFSFDAAFLSAEAANSSFNDWMSVDITDGSTWYNLYYADTSTPFVGTSAVHGTQMTAVSNVSVDLLSLFPASSSATQFTVTVLVGNGSDAIQPSFGYADNFALTGSGPVPPTAAFSGTPTTGTVPLSVAFSDASTGNISAWSWDLGDGTTSSLQNPSHTYAAVGTYTVSLTVTGPGGSDTSVLANYITVTDPPPTAGFSGTPTTGTTPLTVAFSDTSTGNVTSWAWDFGDGNTSTQQNPSHTYTTGGVFTVSLTATGPGGSNTQTRNNYITVNDPVVAAFNGTPTSGTVPLSVAFSDNSTGAPNAWSWDFGDGNTSTLQNPSHTFGAVGTYTVSMTATGAGGSDTLTRTNYITVQEPAPTAAFGATPTSGLIPLPVSFSDASTGAITAWSWDFGDGATSTLQNPSHTYGTAGIYSVSLTVTGPGGSDTLVQSNLITASDTVVANFSGSPTSGVAPLTVSFADASTGGPTGWSWSFGDGATSTQQNPSHVYASVGTYSVSLTVTGPANSDTLTRAGYIVVNEPAPVAALTGTPTSGTAPLVVSFSDASSGTVTAWNWDFGDGNSSTLQNPSHTYAALGSYTVTLTVSGPGGSDTQTRLNYITVNSPVTAGFTGTPTSGVSPLTVSFQDASGGGPTSWAWDFGDGSTSTQQNPSHVYAAGTYSVTLTVSGPGGTDSLTQANYITVTPGGVTGEGFVLSKNPDFSTDDRNFSTADTVYILMFSDVVDFNDLKKSTWEFRDSNKNKVKQNLTSNGDGTYTASFAFSGLPSNSTSWEFRGKLQDNAGASYAPSVFITVTPGGGGGGGGGTAPVANFSGTPTSGTSPLTVNFSDTSSGTPTAWSWDFGDGATSSSQNPTHVYTAVGTYTVTLTATNANGSDTLVRNGYVNVTQGGGTVGEGFILSKNADFSTDDRVFTQADTVYIMVFSDQVDFLDIKKSTWEFRDSNKNKVKQNLTNNGDGTFTASFALSGLPSGATSWEFRGKLEDNSGMKFNPTDFITVTP